MKEHRKAYRAAAVIISAMLTACVFSGCKKEIIPLEDSSEAASSSPSSVAEKSGESSASSAESSVESDDSTVVESSVDSKESSVAESSAESKEESSEVVSEAENSGEESTESSAEESDLSVEDSSEPEAESSAEESSKLKPEDAIRFGKVKGKATIHTLDNSIETHIVDSYIAILSINDDGTYNFIDYNMVFVIDQNDVELFPEDYVPDFSDPVWGDTLM